MQNKQKRILIVLLLGIVVLIATVMAYFVFHSSSQRLTVHFAGEVVGAVTVSGQDLKGEISDLAPPENGSQEWIRSFEYGQYLLDIEYLDGKHFYTYYFAADTGADKKVNMYIDRKGDMVSFRVISRRHGVLENKTISLYATSKSHPNYMGP